MRIARDSGGARVAGQRQRAGDSRRIGGAADYRALEDRVQAVAIGEDVDAVELVRVAAGSGVAGPAESRRERVVVLGRMSVGVLAERRQVREASAHEVGVRARIGRAPRAVADARQAVRDRPVHGTHRSDTPLNGGECRRHLMERVVLALVRNVRGRREDL